MLEEMKALLFLTAIMILPLHAETEAERDARMEWFREARFGMFIHWGLYSVPAGEWKGKPYKGIAEWIQNHAEIPVAEYAPLKDQFNPVNYDPEAWVKLAKDAGMKYLVITSKHHDGFCLWDSKLTDWDIASTPYKKDLLEPLAEACRRHGLKFCLYHSIMDWHHPDWGTKKPWRGNADNPSPDMDAYTAYMKGQLKELLTEYGDVGILWFDGEWEKAWTHERGKDLDDYVRSLQPDIIVNNRVDKGRKGMEGMSKDEKFRGDYGTPEQQIPARGLPGIDWESCMTMNGTWGYSNLDHDWKSSTKLIRNLVDIASKGGNYLLNVGPTAAGEIPAPSVERLEAIGDWMAVNAESIHGTQANPFPKTPWGRCTLKTIDGGTRLFLHIFDWPENGRLEVTGLTNPIRMAKLLGQADAVVKIDGNTLVLPDEAPDPAVSVVAIEIEGTPKIDGGN
jgi:alpha-L-fucosidase